jgi:hypothetical protein
LARHYGIANMLIFHKLSDLDNVGDQGSAMRALAVAQHHGYTLSDFQHHPGGALGKLMESVYKPQAA